jgi:Mn2+/Fe2+ NRAMP family transporter
LLAPFPLAGILLIASNRAIMRNDRSSLLNRAVMTLTVALMFGAAVARFTV